ncbi:MAG: precorrin-8X methylmutase [Planctomycetota bacterium]
MMKLASCLPLVHALYAAPLSGEEIEARSLATIDREAPSHNFTPPQWIIVQRMIHATADFGLMNEIRFSPDVVAIACAALSAGRPLYVDSNMIRAGLSLSRLQAVCPEYNAQSILCHVADEDVASEAKAAGLPRSLFAVRKAQFALNGGIAVFGNAPAGLLELNRLIIEEQIRPALVVAMPVGFVHVIESKKEIMSLNAPFIALNGRRGGSSLAISVIHALLTITSRKEGASEE